MPRSVPFRALHATLAWAMSPFRPCASSSRRQKVRAKYPRGSSRRSTSSRNAPPSFVGVKRISGSSLAPEEVLVDLAGLDQVVDLLEPRVGARLEEVARHADPLEHLEQLLGAAAHVPARREAGQPLGDLVEAHLVVALVAAPAAEGDGAARESLAHDRGDVANLVVLAVGADVERLAVDCLARRLEGAGGRLADVEDMHQWPPGRAVGIHPDLPVAPGEAREVVHDEIETLAWRCAIGGGVPQEGRREIVRRHRAHVPLDEQLALGVRSEGLGLPLLVLRLVGARAVDAARAEVDEAADAGFPCEAGQAYGALVVDRVGDVRRQLAHGIVAELREVNHRIVAGEVGRGQAPDVADQDPRQRPDAVVEPADPVEPGVAAADLVPPLHEDAAEQGADVAVAAGEEDPRHRYQTFQGAAPDAQRSSSSFRSRRVSIGCQKPSCGYAARLPVRASVSRGYFSQVV